MAPRARNSKAGSSSKVDFISNLPENIKEQILTYLPIKEAGRTSVLSSAWKYTWTSIPELKIWYYEFPNSTLTDETVDEIFLQRSSPVLKFDLDTMDYCSFDAFDRWISTLSGTEIKEIKLDFTYCSTYPIHLSFFSCENLTSIFLQSCFLKLPVGFKGFRFLCNLTFRNVNISDDCIKKLISCCPVLENLKLFSMSSISVLDIQARNLKYLHVSGSVEAFYLHTPNLLTLNEYLYERDHQPFQFSKSNHEQALGCPNLEMLNVVGSYLIKCLARLHDIGKFPMIFHNLKNLSIPSNNERSAAVVISILQSAPNLEIYNICDFCGAMNGKKFTLKSLQIVNVSLDSNGVEDAVYFTRFVLESAPQLLELILHGMIFLYLEEEMCFQNLFKLEWASSKAKIIMK